MAKKSNPDRTDRALHAALKRHRGQRLTQAEARDLAWWEKQQREQLAVELLHAIPKGIYCDLAGRQQKLITDAAERHDLPLLEPTVDLYEALPALHDRLVELAAQVRPYIDDDGEGGGLKAEKLRQEIQKLHKGNEKLAIELGRLRDDTLDRASVREALRFITTQLHQLGQNLGRIHPEAQKAMNDLLEQLAGEIESGALKF